MCLLNTQVKKLTLEGRIEKYQRWCENIFFKSVLGL